MDPDSFHNTYFADGTRGFFIMRKFYVKYADLFHDREFPTFDDFRNQIFINLSDLDLSNVRKSKEAYCIGAIKIQCRELLEQAIDAKKRLSESDLKRNPDDPDRDLDKQPDETAPTPEKIQGGRVLLREIALFRTQLRPLEKDVLNGLIDGDTRDELAHRLQLNMNTLDTHIRRIRLRLLKFLEKRGYDSLLAGRIKRK